MWSYAGTGGSVPGFSAAELRLYIVIDAGGVDD